MKKLLISTLATLSCATTMAADTLENCVIQEVIPGKHMTAAFFILKHIGEEKKLISAEIPTIAGTTEIHTMEMVGDVMKMKKLDSYLVKEGDNIFRKGANHLMLFDIVKSPEVGTKHSLTLTFENGEKLSCEAVVKSIDEIIKEAQAHDEMNMHNGNNHKM